MYLLFKINRTCVEWKIHIQTHVKEEKKMGKSCWKRREYIYRLVRSLCATARNFICLNHKKSICVCLGIRTQRWYGSISASVMLKWNWNFRVNFYWNENHVFFSQKPHSIDIFHSQTHNSYFSGKKNQRLYKLLIYKYRIYLLSSMLLKRT